MSGTPPRAFSFPELPETMPAAIKGQSSSEEPPLLCPLPCMCSKIVSQKTPAKIPQQANKKTTLRTANIILDSVPIQHTHIHLYVPTQIKINKLDRFWCQYNNETILLQSNSR
mmetsp:Transcript_18631/g.22761  ORF Transcript_18631/g.22761 Transcript_18631/m.22761 type:complete len:113 (+) Transcript_18631:2038-2376(+)